MTRQKKGPAKRGKRRRTAHKAVLSLYTQARRAQELLREEPQQPASLPERINVSS